MFFLQFKGTCVIFSGSSNGLSVTINIEQYEYMRGPQNDAGIKVKNIFCAKNIN